MDIVSILARQEVFEGLSPQELAVLARVMEREHFFAGEMIFEDTSPGEDLYVILSGKVAVQLEAITPNETVVLSTISEGEILGEFSIIDSEPRSATAVCLEDTEALVINGKRMHELFEKNHHIGYVVMRNMAKIICERIRRTNRRLIASLRKNV